MQVEVADNGSGVPPEDYQSLTLKYHTSKISNFDDLSVRGTGGGAKRARRWRTTAGTQAHTTADMCSGIMRGWGQGGDAGGDAASGACIQWL